MENTNTMKSTAIYMGIMEYEESSSLKSLMYMLTGEPSKLDPHAIFPPIWRYSHHFFNGFNDFNEVIDVVKYICIKQM